MAEEAHIAHADGVGRGALLGLSDPADLVARDVRIETASVAIGHDAIRHLDASFGPRGHRASGAEVDVVGMSGDHEDALDTFVPLGFGHGSRGYVGTKRIRRFTGSATESLTVSDVPSCGGSPSSGATT